MSESRRKSSIDEDMNKVLIVNEGPIRKIRLEDLDSVDIINSEPDDITDVLENLNTDGFDYLLFISKEFDFSNKKSLSKILKKFEDPRYNQVAGLYSDVEIEIGKTRVPLGIRFSFSNKLLYQNILMNSPFLLRVEMFNHIRKTFGINKSVKKLWMYNLILKAVRTSFVFHDAEIRYTMTNPTGLTEAILKELKIIENENNQ